MKFFYRLARWLGIKNKYSIREIKDKSGKVIAVKLINEGENLTLKERLERFNKWRVKEAI